MQDLIKWSSANLSRRGFLGRIAAGAFSALAAASVLRPTTALAGGCTGPFGSGACPSVNCGSKGHCQPGGEFSCGNVSGYCPSGTSCWSSSGHTCCDCKCYRFVNGTIMYCYCHWT